MARCEDCLHYEVCKHHAKMLEEDGYEIEFDDTPEVEKRCAAFKTTADVVPKSESDMLHHLLKDAWERIEELDNLCGELQKAKDDVENLKLLVEMKDVSYAGLEELYDTDTTALIEAREKTEVEVAREIFAEIWQYAELQIESLNIAEKVCPMAKEFFGGGKQAFDLLLDKLAELKKKYQEGE